MKAIAGIAQTSTVRGPLNMPTSVAEWIHFRLIGIIYIYIYVCMYVYIYILIYCPYKTESVYFLGLVNKPTTFDDRAA